MTYPIRKAVLVASGDLRPAANQVCWPAQAAMEQALTRAFAAEGVELVRGHPFDPEAGHGFISSQRMGMDVFRDLDPDVPVVVAEAVWQYSHHVLPGLLHHRGPVLTVANWSGTWPGLVGLLNLNGSLTKSGRANATLWSEDFTDAFFERGLRGWLAHGRIAHDLRHVRDLDARALPDAARRIGDELAADLRRTKAILGVFDEGCMGMHNAIIDDALLNPMGVFKERLSQSALVAAMATVADDDARAVRRWLDERGMTFVTGPDEATDLTDAQVHAQAKMYVAAVRMAHAFGCDAIGIQYQQGLKDSVPASDLVEGLLNDGERPPVFDGAGRELYAGAPLPHFNEVDEGSAVDALVTNRVWRALGLDPATTLHDLRWGERYAAADADGAPIDAFVWALQISGAVPASHLDGGYAAAEGHRQPPMYFPLGGSTLSGVCKPGALVWSRVFVLDGRLHADVGRGTALRLPAAETARRRRATTPEWPILHFVAHGVDRDAMMARHQANHVQVAYAPDAATADAAFAAKAAAFAAMGIAVHVCGDVPHHAAPAAS
ncbi:MAG: fucose isomerase [Trueperaceae bacterium]|nr:fucose isomerase [Trueperaceae bacterium]